MRFVLTDYYSGDHRPYRSMLRDSVSDAGMVQLPSELQEAVAASGAVDGDEIEIVIRRTGARPFGDRKVRLVRPHTYERDPLIPQEGRLIANGVDLGFATRLPDGSIEAGRSRGVLAVRLFPVRARTPARAMWGMTEITAERRRMWMNVSDEASDNFYCHGGAGVWVSTGYTWTQLQTWNHTHAQ